MVKYLRSYFTSNSSVKSTVLLFSLYILIQTKQHRAQHKLTTETELQKHRKVAFDLKCNTIEHKWNVMNEKNNVILSKKRINFELASAFFFLLSIRNMKRVKRTQMYFSIFGRGANAHTKYIRIYWLNSLTRRQNDSSSSSSFGWWIK